MKNPMQGVRVLEVAQFTFVPAAGAVLADWGADVIHVEHSVTGDAQRGLTRVLGLSTIVGDSSFVPIMEGPNRGKRSLGLSLDNAQGREVLYDLVKDSDVFLTNYLPSARAKLGIELEDIRRINPDIIYVRGSGFGEQGEERDKGGYDLTTFWARGGSAAGVTPPGADRLTGMPSGAYGDSMGGMTIAGGIAAALFARATTGETSVVDVSLLGVGAWATQFSINLALMSGGPLPRPEPPKHGSATNPLIGGYRTSDDRWIVLSMLQPGRYWPEFCTAAGREDLITDERFDTVDKLMANAAQAAELVAEIFEQRTFQEWVEILSTVHGQWAAVQDAYETGHDPALRANGSICELEDAEGVRRELVASPVQFDGTPLQLRRAPLFAEHTDDIVLSTGRTQDELIALKIAGAVT
jgi:crotonobetainyl-CoA:carnitine CoA-transferase CaiB-like acyl-CoA transferase